MTYMSRNPQVASVVLDDITTTTPSNPPSGKVKVVDRNGTLFVRNSSGAESAIGTNSSVGSGEKNYIENPSAAASISGWTAAGNLDAVRTATAADLPRENTTKTGIKITSKSPVASGSSDRVYYDVSLDDVDAAGRIMKIKWDQKVTGTYTDGQLEVVITTQADRTTAVATPFTSAIPASDGTFQTYFLAPSTATCSLVIRATADMTTDGGIVISDVVVGPNVQVQGAAIGAWKSYTPATTWISSVNWTGMYREVGGSIECMVLGEVTGTPTTSDLEMDIPSGFTIDTTKLPISTTTTELSLGTAQLLDSGTQWWLGGVHYIDTNSVRISHSGSGNAGIVSASQPFAWGLNDRVGVMFSVPVNELSSNVTLANRALEQYAAWNSTGAGTGSVVSSFNGGIAPTDTPSSTFESFTITAGFNNIQASDSFVLEWNPAGTSTAWCTGNDAQPIDVLRFDGTNFIGASVTVSASGAIVITRGKYRTGTNSAWSALSAGTRWRVRKVSGGASVGYPIAPANITLINSTDNYSGNTKLGLMQYVMGTSYNGVTPNLTAGTNVTSIGSITRGVLVPYQVADGTWRMRFSFRTTGATVSSADNHTLSFVGVVFKNVSGYDQAVSGNHGSNSLASVYAYCRPNTADIRFDTGSSSSPTLFIASGDVELESKPTWAY